jgi:hypothetical protein
MAIHDLVRKETPHGTVTAVWFDSDEDNFVVRHELVHLSFHKGEFMAFLTASTNRTRNTWRIGGTRVN